MLRFDEPMSEYLAHPSLSASDLKHLLKSRFHFAMRHQIKRESNALSFGTLVHTALLEPESFAQYVVAPDLDKRTKEYKAWLAENEGRPTMSHEEADKIEAIKARLQQTGLDKILARGTSEVSCYGHAGEFGDSLDLRARADKWDGKNRVIVDLKTTRDLQWFEKDVFKYGYNLSVPHYTHLFAQELGIDADGLTYVFLAVESEAPFDCGWFVLSPENRERAMAKWIGLLSEARETLLTGKFTGFTANTPREI